MKVSALDKDSALRLARQEVRSTLDAISFCDSLLTPHGISLSPAIDGFERAAAPAAIFNEDRSFWSPSEFGGRPVVLNALFQKKGRSAGTRKVSDLLRVEKPSPTQQRIATALGWVGRATGKARPAEAFLFYLIALESLILGPDKDSELTYRLRVRCAHLLAARKLGSRQHVSKRVSDLYGIRSGIVHKSVRDVAAEELGAARLYAQRAILEVLHTRRIKKNTDLENWFNEQVLK